MKTLTISNGKKIHIFDDLFTHQQQVDMKIFAQNSSYKTTGKSHTGLWETDHGRFLVSHYSVEDMVMFGLYNTTDRITPVMELLEGREVSRCWMLFSDLSTKIYYHTDGLRDQDNLSVLYYVNTEWKSEWNGETIFADDFGEAEIAVRCKPGRLVVFDSSIPHKATSISADAPFRFTANTVWTKRT
jgi:hypothetical protein